MNVVRVRDQFLPALVGLSLSSMVGFVLVQRPADTRLVGAVCLLLCGVVAAAQWPRHASVTVLALLPFLALFRRLLLEFEPWKSADPLLLVAPGVAGVLLLRIVLLEGREIARDRLSKLVLFMFVFSIAEALNPRGGSTAAGVTSLLFTVAPLSWYFIGSEFGRRGALRVLFISAVAAGVFIACYGLNQTWNGLLPWDQLWFTNNGYAALNVNGVVRAFGTFSSAAEYASFLGIGVVLAVAFGLRGRPYLLLATPLLAVALFLESGRTVIVTTVLATVAVTAANSGSYRRAALTLGASVALLVAAFVVGRGALAHTAEASSNPLVSHQLAGLTDPFNSQQSTLSSHLSLFQNGFSTGLDPVGHGTAATTLAAQPSASEPNVGSTEIDASNVFVSYGLFGGVAFLAIIFLSLSRALRVAVSRPDGVSLACLGLLVVTLGQWLNGGFYAVSPLVWFTIGALNQLGRAD